MLIPKLKKYLDENKVRYAVVSHPCDYTAQGTAQAAHISGKEIAKTVMVNITDGEDEIMAMAVLPASDKIDFDLLAQEIGAQKIELAGEYQFKDIFPDCEIGAMPPFGNLYDIPVFVARILTKDDEIAFNAGNHRELIKLRYKDFERLVHPTVLDLTLEPACKQRTQWRL